MENNKRKHYWKSINLIAACVIACMANIHVSGQSVPYRPATNKDLIGVWHQIHVSSHTIRDLSDSWYSGFQYFEFFADGYLKNIILSGENPKLDETTKIIWGTAPKTTKYLFLNDNGLIRVTEAGGRSYQILCTYYTESVDIAKNPTNPNKVPQKGDMLLTYSKGEKIYFFRLLRRMEI